jgi:hypothetical protein
VSFAAEPPGKRKRDEVNQGIYKVEAPEFNLFLMGFV